MIVLVLIMGFYAYQKLPLADALSFTRTLSSWREHQLARRAAVQPA